MKIVNDDVTLRIVNSTRFIGYTTLAGGVFCLGGLGYTLVYHWDRGDVFGFSIGALVLLAAGFGFSRKSDFCFDRNAQKLIWRQSGLFSRQGGEVPFADIEEVVMQCREVSTRGEGTGNVYRLTLRTARGWLPISVNFDGGAQKKCEAYAARIREVLGKPSA